MISRYHRISAIFVLAIALLALSQSQAAAQDAFDAWLQDLRREAAGRGISSETLNAAFRNVRPNPKIVDLDRRQPEFTQTFWGYLDKRVTSTRIERGQRMLEEHQVLLDEIYRRYGVQPRFLVSFWGLESNFGDFKGRFNVIEALATLAYDQRRSRFFRTQLIEALRIIEEGHIAPEAMEGSWAGAMGHLQFMPSTFTEYAVDYDGDGRRDIWSSLPDVFASAANFLSQIGWRGDEIWGREIVLPENFNWDLAGLEVRRPVTFWKRNGVKRGDGGRLPTSEFESSVILPAGHRGPAFLVYKNYRTIMLWNRSILYALAVGHLSDRLQGAGILLNGRDIDDRPLSRAEMEEIQGRLAALGFDVGRPDGIAGPMTRKAIRDYQRNAGYPSDGYPSADLLQRLRRASEVRSESKKEDVN